MTEKTEPLQTGSYWEAGKTANPAAHTPLRILPGANSHCFDGRLMAGDECIAFVEGDLILDYGNGVDGGDYHITPSEWAALIVRAVNNHYALANALRGLLDEIAKSPCADSILDSAAAGHAFAALSQVGGASE